VKSSKVVEAKLHSLGNTFDGEFGRGLRYALLWVLEDGESLWPKGYGDAERS
jgi:hypothetical protein